MNELGVSRGTAHLHKKQDLAFSREWDAAIERGLDAVGAQRGQPVESQWADWTLATYHPSAILRAMQQPDGHFENWYGEGNFNRTAMLYALMQSRGVRPARRR